MAGRIELKYWVNWQQREIILRRWRPFLEYAPYTNEHGIYPIMSLYYDSPSLAFYDEKIEGEKLRSKVRLRGYGYRWQELSPIFLEIKRKVADRVIKYRRKYERFDPDLFQPSTWDLAGDGGGGTVANRSDVAQLELLLQRYRLRPAVQILYQREAYESPFFPSLRIAFDSQLVALHPYQEVSRELLESRDHRLQRDTEYVFEIKSDGGLPRWVMDGIKAGQVTQRAISKYCMGIEKLDMHHREIGVYA